MIALTIKKRLFLSNLLMLVIPAVLSLLALAAGLLLLFSAVLPGEGYRLLSRHETTETRQALVDLSADFLAASDGSTREAAAGQLTALCMQNQMYLTIGRGGEAVWAFGEAVPPSASLTAALAALGEGGSVSDGETELYGVRRTAAGTAWDIQVSNPVVTVESRSLKAAAAVFLLLLAAVVILTVLLTNRFLTRFVFQHIAVPLRTLAEGVGEIRDGNLTCRIDYDVQDEFQPVCEAFCEAFNEMAARLRLSVEKVQRDEEGRKELLASISHDLRSPLTAIRAYVEGLIDGVADTPEKRSAYLATIREKTMEIDTMVRKLFLFSKMDMGEYPYCPEPLDAVAEISDFLRASGEEYRRRGLVISAGPLPAEAPIQADSTYFRSILTNLMDNSAKYKEKELGHVVLSGAAGEGRLTLYVDDDGPGVPPEALPKLFDAFYRSDAARRNPNQGSGLGLAIAAKSIQRMGGRIRGENLPGGGLRIALDIPLAERRSAP